MSTHKPEEIFNIGGRLMEERKRKGLSQETLGTLMRTTGRTVKKYESNETSPRATELLLLSGQGFDVLYIITGERTPVASITASNAAERLAQFVANINLSDEDAQLLLSMAARLSK